MGHGPHVPLSRLPRRLAHKRCKASVRITESDYTCAEFLKAVRAGIHVEEVEEDCSSSDPPPLADVASENLGTHRRSRASLGNSMAEVLEVRASFPETINLIFFLSNS